ncbi:MAG: hypothetical protein ACI4DO_09285 [Roseburia sp.]
MKRRAGTWFGSLIVLAMLFTMLTVVEAKASTSVDISKGNLTIKDSGTYEVKGSTEKYHIEVKEGNPTITIRDVKIDLCNENDDGKSVEAAAINIKEGCNVTLIVDGSNTLYGGNNTGIGANWGYAGINIEKGASLTIKGDAGDKLVVYGGGDYGGSEEGGAAIGSDADNDMGSLTIDGGLRIEAHGAVEAAGIGGGRDTVAGDITIKGGEILAWGGKYAAGIGCANAVGAGDGGTCNNITISGGTITAVGGENAAGIGGSDEGDVNGTIKITGGTITATGGYGGAGIGGGQEGYLEQLQITGGTITATGGKWAAGIGGGNAKGSGDGGGVGNIYIYGGNIKAYGGGGSASAEGEGGAGIGGGDGSKIYWDFIIKEKSPLTIEARGGSWGAGIGSAANGVPSNNVDSIWITLDGGTITATGGKQGAGIGGGNTSANQIYIYGEGTVTATGYDQSCAIGAGECENGGNIYIKGNDGKRALVIDAYAKGEDGAAVIGAADAEGGDIDIYNATVTLTSDTEDSGSAGIGGAETHEVYGSVDHIKIVNCYIMDNTGKTREGCTIGAGFSGDVGDITIRNSEVYGGTIGSCWKQRLIEETTMGDILIENSTVSASNCSSFQKAAIGSGADCGVGDITIKNSTIKASTWSGAGIGGGGYIHEGTGQALFWTGCACGDITITDSNVTATGGDGGAGIGGGWGTSVGDITIQNSTVTASGEDVNSKYGYGGAGIGGGYKESVGNITIENSTVTATGGKNQAGIGSGGGTEGTNAWDTTCHAIILKNSTITATAGENAAGIGTGCGAQFALNSSIQIDDCTINATGGKKGAGIGAGANGAFGAGAEACDIYIRGKSKVIATAGDGGAGIGGGYGGGADTIYIDLAETVYDSAAGDWKYYVKASASLGGAGIGGGGEHGETSEGISFGTEGHGADSIQIHGGYVYATGGAESKDVEYQGAGAGIGGGGRGGRLEEFIVTGGFVEAHSGKPVSQSHAGNDIGSGGNDITPLINDGDAKISGGTVLGDLSSSFTVIIDGGSVSCNNTEAKNSDGTKVYRTIMQTGENYYHLQDLVTSTSDYGTSDIFSDGSGKVYLYLPATDSMGGSTADYTHNGTRRHYYGKTTSDGKAWMKMDTSLAFNSPESEPIVETPFTLTLRNNQSLPSGTSVEFTLVNPNHIAIVSEGTVNSTPEAKVTLLASEWTDYTVKATSAENEMCWSAQGSYSGKVTKKPGTIAIKENPSKVYDGTEVSDPAVECNSDGRVTYNYYVWNESSSSIGAKLSERPKNAGTYAVVAHLSGTSNYTEATSETKVFTIEKRPVKLAMTATAPKNDTSATITAYVLGAVDDPGEVSISINDVDKGTIDVSARNVSIGGRSINTYSGFQTFDGVPGGTYTVKISYTDTQNYSCSNDVEETLYKDKTPRTLTVNNLGITYGDAGWSLGGSIVPTPTATGSDTYEYELIYDEFKDVYGVEPTVEVDGSGDVTYKNAGLAVVKVTVKDGSGMYQDATAYSIIKVSRADLTVTSYAYTGADILDNRRTSITYGSIDDFDYGLEYEGFKNGDTKDTFTNGHGTLEAISPNETSPVGDNVPIAIRRIGQGSVTINGNQYQNVFFSRNYNLDLVPGTIEITKAVLYITANDTYSVYGTEPEYTYHFGDDLGNYGLMPWDQAEDVMTIGIDGSYADYAPGEYDGAIKVTPKTDNHNYIFTDGTGSTIKNGKLTVSKAEVSINAAIDSKVYDKQPVVPQITLTPIASITEELATPPNANITYYELMADGTMERLSSAPKDAGTYKALISVPLNEYYKVSARAVTFTIQKAHCNVEKPQVPDMEMREGLKLSDQTLPAGWAWVNPDKELSTGLVNGYAVYTPEDTRNYFKEIRNISFSVYANASDNAADGSGSGSADGSGNGNGNGSADGSGNGNGSGSADGSGNANGSGSADGSGNGNANGSGNTDGSGNANGNENTDGTVNGNAANRAVTGDASHILLWSVIGILMLAVMGTILVVAKRKKKM